MNARLSIYLVPPITVAAALAHKLWTHSRISNAPKADALIRKTYREGFGI
jgi:hypothetical protein